MMRDWDLRQQFMIQLFINLYIYYLIIKNENETPNPGKKRWTREIEQRR
ncbi:hypothetical protein LOK49_LG08G01920 [Camellia lanceoleosa]|uniref:Uncharacterized protein n=1 Tax=Camellia lanceoleosa TaxID=1840588 RepID=A0ACC0GTC6_9ERIC|nr:hypothetical protein LOK49_LG08G01920 [Camellia lanceoleosa]